MIGVKGFISGASKVTITPDRSVFLAGLSNNRRSTGVHDDLWARCLALSDGEETLILVSLDLIGLFLDQVNLIRGEAEKHGLNGKDIIVASTHQHSGPDTLGLWGPDPTTSGVDEDYMAYVRKRVLDAILEATGNMREAVLRFTSTKAPGGVARNSRNPGVLDPEISVLNVETPKGETIAVLINFALHPEVLWSDNTLITADFPNYLYATVEEELGGVALFFNGALGGMVTPDVEEHTFKESERIGRTLAEAALKALRGEAEKQSRDSGLTVKRETLSLPVENQKFKTLHSLGVIKRSIQNYEITTELYHVEVGDAEIITIPGEALPEIGLELKAKMTGSIKFLIGLTNDEIGYIIPEEEWSPGRYEESMSLGPRTGTLMMRKILEMLQDP